MGIGSQNAYIVKRKGIQFSRDPLNLVNLHSRKVRNRSHGSYGSKKKHGREEDDANSVSSTAALSTPRYARTLRFRGRGYYERRRWDMGNEMSFILIRNAGCWHRTR